ncbi:MAG TPA: hypothetical protein VHG28_12065 [Longimicrobiaceae bacterium]|nr:hypothetical protein [Longimicrobiaceae bacterium]
MPDNVSVLRGYLDPDRSTEEVALFGFEPCSTRIPIPEDLTERLEETGTGTCGQRVLPRVVIHLRRGSVVADAFAAIATAAESQPFGASVARSDLVQRHVQLEFSRYGSVYDWQIYVEGQPVRNPQSTTKGYLYDLPGYPVTGKLDVGLRCQGVNGAEGTLVVTVDGRVLQPTLVVRVNRGGGAADHSYDL